MTVTQAAFTQALLDPKAMVPKGLIDPNGNPAGKRFDVYRNNVIVSLMDAMETAFPVIRKLIGEQNFRNLSMTYVRQHPPENPILMFYGGAFAPFLEAFEPLAQLPYLADVARLELARRTVYHAADSTPLAGDAMSKIAPDALLDTRFSFAPAFKILHSPYPIVSIWDFNMTENAPKPEAVSQTALLTRPELDVDMTVISYDQALFLSLLKDGKTLGQAYEKAMETNDAFDLSLAITLMLETKILTKTTC